MAEAYYPAAVEAAWASWWSKHYSSPDVAAAKAAGEDGRFVMVM